MSRQLRIIVHLGIWIGLILVLNSNLVSLEWGPMSRAKGTLLIPLILGMGINAILFYSNAEYFIPQYLHTRKTRKYWSWAAIMVIGLTAVELTFDTLYLYQGYVENANIALTPAMKSSVTLELIAMLGAMDLFINISFWALSFLFRLPKDWIRNERLKQQLLQDKLTAELDFLKAQINPHFLFNGINSIYHLMEEDVPKAQKILLQFSELLRYQLYECREDFMPLHTELQYVSNYLEIETIRKGEDALISIDLPKLNGVANGGNLRIAPMLFSPFLENAFKYLSLYSEKEKNRLSIKIEVDQDIVHMSAKNTFDHSVQRKKNRSSSGIGLDNVKRRLNILYPDQHQLVIEEDEGCFSVDLKIELS